MIKMSMKQKIILYSYRDGYSERWIARELKINREFVRRYLSEYKKARDKISDGTDPDGTLIEEIIKIP
jgi:DNA-binding CsgD family transcriptional regulator